MTVAQQTSTAILPTLFQRFRTKVLTLRVNETKITSENAFNGDHFKTEGNQESGHNKNTLWGYIHQPCTPFFLTGLAKIKSESLDLLRMT